MENNNELYDLYATIMSRKEEKQEGSYTCYLFEKGLDKILKKVGEECSETIIAAKTATMRKPCWKYPTLSITFL